MTDIFIEQRFKCEECKYERCKNRKSNVSKSSLINLLSTLLVFTSIMFAVKYCYAQIAFAWKELFAC